MTDLVLVVVPGLGPLALAPDVLRAARAKGREIVGDMDGVPTAVPSAPALVTAEDLATRTGIPASWWEAQAREQRVPHVRIGRRVRFDEAEALACDAVRRRPAVATVTGLPTQRGRASD